MSDLSDGFQVEEPPVFVPWGANESTLRELFPANLRTVTTGYFTVECVSLNGLRHVLGMHMTPREDGRLHELEFFRHDWQDSSEKQEALSASFDIWQRHLELTFGRPTVRSDGDCDLPLYEWRIGTATVRHFCQYRFGPEQHVRIARY